MFFLQKETISSCFYKFTPFDEYLCPVIAKLLNITVIYDIITLKISTVCEWMDGLERGAVQFSALFPFMASVIQLTTLEQPRQRQFFTVKQVSCHKWTWPVLLFDSIKAFHVFLHEEVSSIHILYYWSVVIHFCMPYYYITRYAVRLD